MADRCTLQSFELLMDPPRTTAQQKGERYTGRYIQHYEKKPVKTARAAYREELMPWIPDQPHEGPLSVTIEWTFRHFSRKPQPGQRWKITRPDCDNMSKLLLDVMTGLHFWKDDAEIAELILRKRWDDHHHGVYIKIEELID